MIVRELEDGRLLCIHQPTHALMAEAFCRHWGNRDFARPSPHDAVMVAVGQHDNGWWEWEQQPRLRSDGYPMDFVHDDDPLGKVALWRRGVARAGLLVARHAALLYQPLPRHGWDDGVQAAIQHFVDDAAALAGHVRLALQEVPEATDWLRPARIEANVRLLQFGDIASLQVLVPWAKHREIHHCPVDFEGAETTIVMMHDETHIHFEPWPFDVETFTVSILGRVLTQTHFPSEAEYHAALLAAPFKQMTWRVER